MRLIESIKMEEGDLRSLEATISLLMEKHGETAKVFWHSERFSTECYLVVYEDTDASTSS